MVKKTVLCLVALASLVSCQQKFFGVDETVWSTLNETERNKVIEGYNKRKETELANKQKRREKELENEKLKLEVQAQNAPFYAAADVVNTVFGKNNESTERHSALRIQQISNSCGRSTLTIGEEQFEVAPIPSMSHAWVKGQKVALSKNEESLLYAVKIKNLDNGEIVTAKKIKKSTK